MLVQKSTRKFYPHQCVQSSRSHMFSNCCSLFIFREVRVLLARCCFRHVAFSDVPPLEPFHPPVFHNCLLPNCCLSLVNSWKRWRDLVFEALETAFTRNTYIYIYIYSPFCTRISRLRLLLQVKFPSEAVFHDLPTSINFFHYKYKRRLFRSVIENRPDYITK